MLLLAVWQLPSTNLYVLHPEACQWLELASQVLTAALTPFSCATRPRLHAQTASLYGLKCCFSFSACCAASVYSNSYYLSPFVV